MSNPLEIKLIGAEELQARLTKASASLKTEINAKIQDGVQAMASEAKQRAPVRFGILKNLISSQKTENGADMISGADYSAYVEFGTGTKVEVPEDLQEFALQFKGHKEVIGIRAQPFFFPAVKRITPIIQNDIKKTLDKI